MTGGVSILQLGVGDPAKGREFYGEALRMDDGGEPIG